MNELNFTLSSENLQNLQNLSELLNKDISTILGDAIDAYFVTVQKQLLEKQLDNENKMTNLDFDEFWDDVDF